MTNNILDDAVLDILHHIFSKYSSINLVKLYGSRAKGTHQYYSDVDLALFGDNNLSRFVIAEILMLIEESSIPYKIDIQSYADIKNNNLRNHIDSQGVIIYEQ
jgi:predicted nucleotidyltransferase